jgi:hypothetical protein
VKTGDGMLDVFRKRDDPAVREAYVAAQEKEADDRRTGGKKKNGGATGKKNAAEAAPARGKRADLIQFALPESVAAGKPVTVKIEHRLPADLGEQVLTVTLKGGAGNQRLDRKTVTARGTGVAEVTFLVPADVPAGTVSFAAFVGADFAASLQHLQSATLPAR